MDPQAEASPTGPPEAFQFTALFNELPCACFIVTREGVIRTANSRAETLLATGPDALAGRDVLTLYADVADGLPRARDLFDRFLEGQSIDGQVLAFQADDGRIVRGQTWVQPVVDDTGHTVESRSMVFDVTAQHEAEVALQKSRRRFRTAFEYAPTGMALLDSDGRMLDANRALCRLVGSLRRLTIGQRLASLVSDEYEDALEGALQASEPVSIEVELASVSGPQVWVRLTLTRLDDDVDDDVRYIAHIDEITEARSLREQLHEEATHDALTGLLNRRGLLERAEQLLSAADRAQRPVTLIFLDIDGLKKINDGHGHPAGDQVITEVADSLRNRFRREDHIARWGGDEFCVLLDATDDDAAVGIIEDWRQTMTQRAGGQAPVSIGYAVRPPGSGWDLNELITAADRDMYRARNVDRSSDCRS